MKKYTIFYFAVIVLACGSFMVLLKALKNGEAWRITFAGAGFLGIFAMAIYLLIKLRIKNK
ncbi:MAG: hypothetical protein WCS03_03395 [Bacteroidota bacterium]